MISGLLYEYSVNREAKLIWSKYALSLLRWIHAFTIEIMDVLLRRMNNVNGYTFGRTVSAWIMFVVGTQPKICRTYQWRSFITLQKDNQFNFDELCPVAADIMRKTISMRRWRIKLERGSLIIYGHSTMR